MEGDAPDGQTKLAEAGRGQRVAEQDDGLSVGGGRVESQQLGAELDELALAAMATQSYNPFIYFIF